MARRRYELTDRKWAIIKPLLSNKPRGVPRADDRRVINGICWRFRSGAAWADYACGAARYESTPWVTRMLKNGQDEISLAEAYYGSSRRICGMKWLIICLGNRLRQQFKPQKRENVCTDTNGESMSIDWIAIGMSILALGLLAVGLVTGRMPNSVVEPERENNPVGYWALGAVYLMVSVASLYIAIKS